MKFEIKFTFRVYKEDKGFWCECEELSSCRTQAENLDELEVKAREALALYLS